MAPAVELATGYITLAVESSEISKAIGRGFAGGDKIAGKAGTSMGRAMSRGFEQNQPDLDGLRKNVEEAEAKVTASVERNSRKQEDAKRKVEIAQAKLTEATLKYKAGSSQALQAADRLSTAQQKYEAATLQARSEQEKLNRELQESRGAFQSAEQAAERAARGIKGTFSDVGSAVKSALSGDFKSAFAGLRSDASRAADGVEQEFTDAGKDAGEGFSTQFSTVLGTTLGAAGGLGIGLSISEGIGEGLNREKISDRLGAQLALTEPQSERAGEAAGVLYRDAYGDSLEGVTETIGQIMSTIPGMNDATVTELESYGSRVLDISAAYGMDTAEIVQTAGIMITRGLADNMDEATDLITASLQETPANLRSEVFPVMDEYAGYFAQLGIDGPAALGLITRAADEGPYAMDKWGDAIKEFTIRATDMSKLTGDAYDELGIDMQDVTTRILEGGPAAEAATAEIVSALLAVEDPAKQAELAIALFGTPLEDIGTDQIPEFLDALLLGEAGLGDFSGAAENMGTQLNENTATDFESFKRSLSGGFVSFMETEVIPVILDVWGALQPVGEWMREHKDVLGPMATGIALVATAVGAWSVYQWALAAAVNATIWPMTAAVIGIGLLVGAVIWAYNEVEWFRDVVDTSWAKIREWTAALAEWWTEDAWPKIISAVQWLGDKVMWFWNDIIIPAWTGIRVAIAVAAGLIISIFEGLVWVLDHVLGDEIRFLWSGVVEPVFRWIWGKIQDFAGWFRDTAVPWITNAIGWVGDKFSWLWNDKVRPAWNNIKGGIVDAWNWVKDKAFDPMMEWLDDKIPGGFEGAKDAIAEQWGKIKELAASPIRFFVDTIYNDGLRKNVNNVMDKIGLDSKHHLPRMSLPRGMQIGGGSGMALGGIVPGYQARKVDEHLIPMRSGEGVLVPEATRAIGHETIHSLNHAANAGGEAAARQVWGTLHGKAYAGNPLPGESPFFSGGHWANVARAGSMYVKGGQQVTSSFSLKDATNIWDRAAGLRVKYGTGDAQVHASYAAGNPNWYGYSTGSGIQFNRGIEGSASRELRKGVAIHEIGHSLGLPHVTNRASVMHPMMASSLVPTQSDIRALQQLYPGGTGKLGSGIDDLIDPVKSFMSGIPGMLEDAFTGNVLGTMIGSIAKNLGSAILGHVMDLDDAPRSASDFEDRLLSPKLFDGGGVIDEGFHLIEHRRKAPDYALPAELVKNLESVATEGNQGGTHFHAPVYTVSPDELWEAQIEQSKRQEALAL